MPPKTTGSGRTHRSTASAAVPIRTCESTPGSSQVRELNRPCRATIEVNDLNTIVDGLRDNGFDTVGEVRDYENIYRLCYVRGPEGLIVELAENISSERAS